MPKISVIMSVYNGEAYLAECIDSILTQTLKDFDFFITDDCSSDKSLEIIDSYKQQDKRIKVIENKENIGLTRSLNRMIEMSDSEYIARMDADDISRSMRFERQVDFMCNHSDVGVCAVNSVKAGAKSNQSMRRGYFQHDEIAALMLFMNPMPHAPSMIRAALFHDQNIRYNEEFKIIQDYELWQRLIKKTKFHILKDILFENRTLPTSVTATSSKKKNNRENYLFQIYRNEFHHFGIDVTQKILRDHLNIASNNINDSSDFLDQTQNWLDYLLRKNEETATYNKEVFRNLIKTYWFKVCTRSTSLGWESFRKYRKSDLFTPAVGAKDISKLIVKCLIKYRQSSANGYI